jgi:hypothetical protein
MQKSNLFKGFAVFNFVFFVLLFLLYQIGELDALFEKKEIATESELPQTAVNSPIAIESGVPTPDTNFVSDKTTLSEKELKKLLLYSSKSMMITPPKPIKSLGAITETIEVMKDKVSSSFYTVFYDSEEKKLEQWIDKNVQDSLNKAKQRSDLEKERVFMTSSKSMIIDGTRVRGEKLPPPPDIDSLKK